MRLHLPTSLRAALIACMACATVSHAATFTAEGVVISEVYLDREDSYIYKATLDSSSNRFYDGGKGRDWADFQSNAYNIYTANDNDLGVFGILAPSISVQNTSLNFNKLKDDSGHCWAYTSSNMLQYWQSYYGVFANKAKGSSNPTPVHGLTYDKEYQQLLGGTQSLKLNKLFYDNWEGSYGGSTTTAFSWYLAGNTSNANLTTGAAGGYFKQYFTDPTTTNITTSVWNGQYTLSATEFAHSIKTHFGYEKTDSGSYELTNKGQILYLELVKVVSGKSSSHAITCYGFDTNANGEITALYVVNSDDAKQQLVKVYGKLTSNGYELYSDENCYTKWGEWRVTGWSSINTPDVLKSMLAEYESGKQTWMGNLESWTNTAAVAADVNVLPTDETGWMTYAGADTAHAGYYNTYYTTGRDVQFNDEATNTNVAVAENITAGNMTVDNTNKAYTFNGGESKKTITVGDFVKSGSGSLSFSNIKLVADSATLGSDVTFDELHVKGTLNADGKVIYANSIRLDGNTTIGNIGSTGTFNPEKGSTALTITGGVTTVNNSGGWMNLKSLELSEEARLVMSTSVHVSENITTSATTTGTLAEGTEAGIQAKYCIYVGTEENGKLVEGTGDVSLKGSLTTTDNAYIKILGAANVSGNITSGGTLDIGGDATVGGNVTSNGAATIGGTLTAGSVTAGSVTLKNGGSIGSIGIKDGKEPGENVIGTTAMVISGGEVKVTGANWTNLKSLDISNGAKLNITAASVSVAENISSNATATGSLAEGTSAGLLASWCIKVGTLENGTRKEGTGDVDLKGDMTITQKGYINILGNAKVTGNITSGGKLTIGGDATVGGNVTSNDAATIGGTLTAGSVTLKNGGSIGAIGIVNGTASDSTIGTTAMVISGGTVDITSDKWTDLKSLEMSGNSKLNVSKASVYVAENITSSITGEQTTNLNAKWCIKVGTLGEDGKLKANTGDVNLKGDMTAGAYIKILGNANVSGTLSTSGTDADHHITIGGNATVGGSLSAKKNVTIGGLAKLNGGGSVDGTVTAGSMELAAGKSLTAKSGLTVNGSLTGGTVTTENGAKASISSDGSMNLGGSVENISLSAKNITVVAADERELVLKNVDVVLTGGELSLTNVRVQGACSFSSSEALETKATLNASGVTFVLDSANSSIGNLVPQAFTLEPEAQNAGNPLYLNSDMLAGLEVKGSVTLDISNWADEIKTGGYDSLVMTFAEDSDFSRAQEVNMTLGNNTLTPLEIDAANPNVFKFSLPQGGQAIPEPATATLSLLALASLMARRRRK